MNAERAAGWVRRWVALYTRGLPAEIQQERRDEIDSDLWSQLHDAVDSAHAEASLAGEIVARLVFGIPADLSWRVEQQLVAGNQVAPTLRPTTATRALAAMAIIGGVGWMIWPIPQAMVGREWPAGAAVSWLLFFSVVGGTWALAGATLALITEFQDRIRTWTAALGALGAVLGAFSVLGLFAAIVALPIGTAFLVWDLGRAGVLGRRLSRAHFAAAIVALSTIGVIFLIPALYDDRATAVPLLSLFIPYAFSWIAVGWSLRRGAPMPAPEPQGPQR
jgi:hypothetical protein